MLKKYIHALPSSISPQELKLSNINILVNIGVRTKEHHHKQYEVFLDSKKTPVYAKWKYFSPVILLLNKHVLQQNYQVTANREKSLLIAKSFSDFRMVIHFPRYLNFSMPSHQFINP